METKRDIEAKAKALIGTNPEEAIKLYQEIWEAYSAQFNAWDAFYVLKAMRASSSPDLGWAKELAEKYIDEKVGNLYGWLIIDKCVKGKTRNELLANEKIIRSMFSLSSQRNLKEDETYLCPTTIAIFKLCDAHAENLFNARKINDLLLGLDYHLLTEKAVKIETQEKGDIELASDLEKFFAYKTKALLKLGEFESCKEVCKQGLELINNFHFNNDLWLKMRLALSEDGLGNHEISEKILKELLESKAGNDKWFLYRDISEVYYEQKDYEKAWKYAVDAAFYGNEPHYMIGLYLLQARILFKLGRPSEGKILAELIAAILKEQKWGVKPEYSRLFNYYKVNPAIPLELYGIMIEARKFWQKERYGDKTATKGTIVSIHKSGKIGRIKDQNNNLVGFHKKDLVKKMKSIEELIGAGVEFFIMESFDGKIIAENIIVTERHSKTETDNLKGRIFDGTVKRVTEFGIFFKLPGSPDGLLYVSNLPENLKSSYKEFFKQGKTVKVRIERITDKGAQLKLAETLN